jgi:hypothetical protein
MSMTTPGTTWPLREDHFQSTWNVDRAPALSSGASLETSKPHSRVTACAVERSRLRRRRLPSERSDRTIHFGYID